jgi:hypothetical protein
MTVNEAIEALTALRDEGQGEAHLLFEDNWHVVEIACKADHHGVFVCDQEGSSRAAETEEEAREALCRYAVDEPAFSRDQVYHMSREQVYRWLEKCAAREVDGAIQAVLYGVGGCCPPGCMS